MKFCEDGLKANVFVVCEMGRRSRSDTVQCGFGGDEQVGRDVQEGVGCFTCRAVIAKVG
jgi:hypothetical protein